MINDQINIEHTYIAGVAIDKNVARISIVGIADVPGMAYKIFSALAWEKISVDLILQSIGRNKTKDISFTVSKSELPLALEVLEKNKDLFCCDHVSHDASVAKLSIVGAGMVSNPGVAAMMFEALYEANVNINMISTSEAKLSVLLSEAEVERAANFVHDRFMEEQPNWGGGK